MADCVHVILRYGDVTYEYDDPFPGLDDVTDDERWRAARYMYEEGNYGCDCNRSLFIQRHCDDAFPEMGCGSMIALVGMTMGERDSRAEVSAEEMRERARAAGLWLP